MYKNNNVNVLRIHTHTRPAHIVHRRHWHLLAQMVLPYSVRTYSAYGDNITATTMTTTMQQHPFLLFCRAVLLSIYLHANAPYSRTYTRIWQCVYVVEHRQSIHAVLCVMYKMPVYGIRILLHSAAKIMEFNFQKRHCPQKWEWWYGHVCACVCVAALCIRKARLYLYACNV